MWRNLVGLTGYRHELAVGDAAGVDAYDDHAVLNIRESTHLLGQPRLGA
jgi:hypothetical protein